VLSELTKAVTSRIVPIARVLLFTPTSLRASTPSSRFWEGGVIFLGSRMSELEDLDEEFGSVEDSNRLVVLRHVRSIRRTQHSKKREHARRLSKYGLTPSDYQTLLKSQYGVCAICREPPSANRRLCVDHDHQDNSVRGLLCDRCNRLIGNAQDSPRRLRNAYKYLKKHNLKKVDK
jgi:hypothetical protein